MWFVYILKCADGSLYAGITKDLERRVEEHNNSALGAKYTRGRRPVKLVYSCARKNKSLAAKEECRIKVLSRLEKIKLITVGKKYGRAKTTKAKSKKTGAGIKKTRQGKRH